VRVATFNLHAGVDGWGRPSAALEHAVSLDADVLVCPETWRGDDDPTSTGTGHPLAMNGTFAELATAERLISAQGGRTWQPLLAHFTGEHGLYFSEHRTLTKFQSARRAKHGALEHGRWGSRC